jgi:exosortase family protein XrtM
MAEQRSQARNLRFFFKIYKREIRFLLLFATLFALINLVYLLAMQTSLGSFVLSGMTAKPCAAIINFISPENGVILQDNMLLSDNHVPFAVVSGCEGIQGIFLLISAICAFPVNVKHKVKGLLYGVPLLYALNLARIVGLHYVAAYQKSSFEFAHWYVGQTLIIVLSCVFFLFWIARHAIRND